MFDLRYNTLKTSHEPMTSIVIASCHDVGNGKPANLDLDHGKSASSVPSIEELLHCRNNNANTSWVSGTATISSDSHSVIGLLHILTATTRPAQASSFTYITEHDDRAGLSIIHRPDTDTSPPQNKQQQLSAERALSPPSSLPLPVPLLASAEPPQQTKLPPVILPAGKGGTKYGFSSSGLIRPVLGYRVKISLQPWSKSSRHGMMVYIRS